MNGSRGQTQIRPTLNLDKYLFVDDEDVTNAQNLRHAVNNYADERSFALDRSVGCLDWY